MLVKIYNWYSDRFLNCRQATRLVSDSFERPLSRSEHIRLRILCFMCPFTNRYDKHVNMLHDSLCSSCDDIAEKVEKSSLSDECKQRMREELARNNQQ